jgi:YecR-like lipoprotein
MRTMIIFATALAMTGCAVQKELVPTGGSRSDGTVELSYEYGMFETPKIDHAQGAYAAAQRCKAWGYSDAQAFGGGKSQCQAFNGYGNCIHTLVTIQYQCIGAAQPQ